MTQSSKVFQVSGLISLGVIYGLVMVILLIVFSIVRFDAGILLGITCVVTLIFGLLLFLIYSLSKNIAKTDNEAKAKLENGEYKNPKRGEF